MKNPPAKPALELIEEAMHLVRSASAQALAAYYIGSLPFILGLLYYWADMSRSPFAQHHIAEASLGMAVLFVWMKFWQAVFALRIRAEFAGDAPPVLTAARCRRILATQTALQPLGLVLFPVSCALVVAAPWMYSFFQSVTALGDSDDPRLRSFVAKAWRQAMLWPTQNCILLLVVGALFGFFLFLNWTIACATLPALAKMFLGIESVFTRGGVAMMNSTFFAVMLGLVYLCVDPVLKAAYVLRCFYGESIQSGADLKAELRRLKPTSAGLAIGIMTAMMLCTGTAAPRAPDEPGAPASSRRVSLAHADKMSALPGFALAAETAPFSSDVSEVSPESAPPLPPLPQPTAPTNVAPEDLDRAISDTLEQRKYSWRMPREGEIEEEQGVIGRFLDRVSEMLRRWMRAAADWLERMLDKLFRRDRGLSIFGGGGLWSLNLLIYALLTVVVVAAVILLMRTWYNRRQKSTAPLAQAIESIPDIADETASADQLPEDSWTRLARELLQRGEFRLALRAFYFASLAHLAGRSLIRIARFKSNRDYERELRRRGHSLPGLQTIFSENVSVFDRSWYGRYEVTDELVNDFAKNVERIKTTA